jgi:hypothetical protein
LDPSFHLFKEQHGVSNVFALVKPGRAKEEARVGKAKEEARVEKEKAAARVARERVEVRVARALPRAPRAARAREALTLDQLAALTYREAVPSIQDLL